MRLVVEVSVVLTNPCAVAVCQENEKMRICEDLVVLKAYVGVVLMDMRNVMVVKGVISNVFDFMLCFFVILNGLNFVVIIFLLWCMFWSFCHGFGAGHLLEVVEDVFLCILHGMSAVHAHMKM